MQIEKGYIYHIYNQGNNKQKIFFEQENYLFFLRKIRTHILPYGDILAWCFTPSNNLKFYYGAILLCLCTS